MYDVDVKKINQILMFSDQLVSESQSIAEQMQQGTKNFLLLLAAQRILQIQFEVFTDVANLLIDGFVMRDPGGYEDMVDILDDEKVISLETSSTLRELIDFYRQSVKEYLTFEIEQTELKFVTVYPRLHRFAIEVRNYLEAELPAKQLL